MSKRSDIHLIDDILVCMEKIHSYVGGLFYEQFRNDSKTQDATARNIEIIGEATKHLSDTIKLKHNDIP